MMREKVGGLETNLEILNLNPWEKEKPKGSDKPAQVSNPDPPSTLNPEAFFPDSAVERPKLPEKIVRDKGIPGR